jgi:hypothetical protein
LAKAIRNEGLDAVASAGIDLIGDGKRDQLVCLS